MKSRGQISFDLMIAVLVLVVFIQGLSLMTATIAEGNTATIISIHEKRIARELASALALSNASAGSESLTYTIPLDINVGGEAIDLGCEIEIGSNSITVTVPNENYFGLSEDVVQTVPIAGSLGSAFSGQPASPNPPLSCGATITIVGSTITVVVP